jgi:hypothetical protein
LKVKHDINLVLSEVSSPFGKKKHGTDLVAGAFGDPEVVDLVFGTRHLVTLSQIVAYGKACAVQMVLEPEVLAAFKCDVHSYVQFHGFLPGNGVGEALHGSASDTIKVASGE